MTKSEATIKAEIRLAIGSEVTLWAQPSGVGKTNSGNTISFGLCNGSSDLIGIRNSDGKFVAIEVKTPLGLTKTKEAYARALCKRESGITLTDEETRAFLQQQFLRLINAKNGLAGFATSKDDALRIVRG